MPVMKKISCTFSKARVDYYLDAEMAMLKKLVHPDRCVLLADQHVFDAHPLKFKGWNCIVLRSGEEYKVQATVDSVVEKLIALEADRGTTLVGVGGGVITDLTGYIASVYMRGIPFGFIPTTILSLVDASIGGKNGIDVGVYKNMVGVIRQPSFILHDYSLLRSLPEAEWVNGFAEIIKHACIRDAAMFRELEAADLNHYRNNKKALAALIARNVGIKNAVVKKDEFEKGDRRLLNFGHTLAHALENQYELSHGQAVAIGMIAACEISAKYNGFAHTQKVENLITRYGLPARAVFSHRKVMTVLKMDKKREKKDMRYILLRKIGQAYVESIPVKKLEQIIQQL